MRTGNIVILGQTSLDTVWTNTAPVLLRIQRELPVGIDNFIEIGHFIVSGGTHSFRITTYSSGGTISITKQYIISSTSNSHPNWASVIPLVDSGSFGADYSLDIRQPSGGYCYLRLRRTFGDRTGIVEFKIEYIARITAIFTETFATGNDSLVTRFTSGIYQNIFTKRNGINTSTPGTSLQITGGFAITSENTAVQDPGTGNASISGWLQTGGLRLNYNLITANYLISLADYFIEANCISGNLIITCPTAINNSGRTFIIKKIDSSSNTLTIIGVNNQTFDGAVNRILSTQYQVLRIISNGINWSIV